MNFKANDKLNSLNYFVLIKQCSSKLFTKSIYLSFSTDDGDSRIKHAKLSLQDIVDGRDLIENHLFDGRWVSNTELVYRTGDGNVISYNAFNNNTQLLVSNITMVSSLVVTCFTLPILTNLLIFHFTFRNNTRSKNTAFRPIGNMFSSSPI